MPGQGNAPRPASRRRLVHDVGALHTVIRANIATALASLPGLTSNEKTDATHAAYKATITTASMVATQRAKDAGQKIIAPSFYVRQRNEMRNMQPHLIAETSARRCICSPHIAQKMSTDVHRF